LPTIGAVDQHPIENWNNNKSFLRNLEVLLNANGHVNADKFGLGLDHRNETIKEGQDSEE